MLYSRNLRIKPRAEATCDNSDRIRRLGSATPICWFALWGHNSLWLLGSFVYVTYWIPLYYCCSPIELDSCLLCGYWYHTDTGEQTAQQNSCDCISFVIGTVCPPVPSISCPHPLCLFFEVASGSRLSSSGVPSHDFYHNFCSACTVTVVVIFRHLSRSFYLVTYLLTILEVSCELFWSEGQHSAVQFAGNCLKSPCVSYVSNDCDPPTSASSLKVALPFYDRKASTKFPTTWHLRDTIRSGATSGHLLETFFSS